MAEIDLRHLQYFVAAADSRSFVKAAKLVNVSQPAITKSIQRMEQWFGHTLFERGAELRLTVFGESVLGNARELLRGFDDLTQAARAFDSSWAGTLKIGAGPLMADTIIGEAVGRIVHTPAARISITVDNYPIFPAMLKERKIDLFVADISELAIDVDMEVKILRPSQFQWFGRLGHPLAGRGAIGLAELLSYPIVMPELPVWARDWFASHQPGEIEASGSLSPFHRMVVCSHLSTLKRIVLSSDALSAMTEVALGRSPYVDEVDMIACTEDTPWSHAGIVTMKKRPLPPIAEMLIEEIIRISEGN